MNFLTALQHAFIGYGIRRKSWNKTAVLQWHQQEKKLGFGLINTGTVIWARISNLDAGDTISIQDANATDWEAINWEAE